MLLQGMPRLCPSRKALMNGYWEHLQNLVASGRPFAAVTLVDVIASAPANAGAKMLVTAEGQYFGSVGGGKIEMKAIAEAKALLAEGPHMDTQNQAGARHRFAEWNLQRDVGMTCGGSVRLFFEAYNVVAW